MTYSNVDQIITFKNHKVVIDARDKMTAASNDKAASIHGQSKIQFIVVDHSQKEKSGTQIANYYMDPDEAKYIANEVLNNNTSLDYNVQKIIGSRRNEKGLSKVYFFQAKYNDGMKYPWELSFSNGYGKAVTSKTGGTYCAKGSFQQDVQIRVYLDEASMKRFWITILDYIRNFELINYSKLAKIIEQHKEQERRQYQNRKSS